jgi:hypothetical protein
MQLNRNRMRAAYSLKRTVYLACLCGWPRASSPELRALPAPWAPCPPLPSAPGFPPAPPPRIYAFPLPGRPCCGGWDLPSIFLVPGSFRIIYYFEFGVWSLEFRAAATSGERLRAPSAERRAGALLVSSFLLVLGPHTHTHEKNRARRSLFQEKHPIVSVFCLPNRAGDQNHTTRKNRNPAPSTEHRAKCARLCASPCFPSSNQSLRKPAAPKQANAGTLSSRGGGGAGADLERSHLQGTWCIQADTAGRCNGFFDCATRTMAELITLSQQKSTWFLRSPCRRSRRRLQGML